MRVIQLEQMGRRTGVALVALVFALVATGCGTTAEMSASTPGSSAGTETAAPPITEAAPTTAPVANATATQAPDEPAPPRPTVAGPTVINTAAPDATNLPEADSPKTTSAPGAAQFEVREYDVPAQSHPHDVAPAADGGVWYTAQASGALGWLDPATGRTEHIPLGRGSAPHGVITGPDGAAWITDGGLNAIVRVGAETREVTRYDLPADRPSTNLNTAVFDVTGKLWFTGQEGIYGVFDPATGEMRVFDAPRGRGPYGITATADGKIYYASLAGSYLGQIDPETGEATVLEPPTAGQGARRAWTDSAQRVWVSAWNTGQLARYDPATDEWMEWKLPDASPKAYAVYVDWQDKVWLSDFGNNSLVRFDPATEQWETILLPSPSASVRQIHGRPGEIWGAESATDKLVMIRVR